MFSYLILRDMANINSMKYLVPEACIKIDEKIEAPSSYQVQMINRILFPMQLDTGGHSYYLKNK